ncbi:COX15/CtaA family protein [Algoriphagus sp. C2-6-M1]|uniref:COX15/CtaA family protein n=1 Tax=Algoriphagus persicinus TaxID=3108754 RepID=UPI002B39917F|nr:COX15/CtaA family protein [Algoriphagus sp. C2-6-M1]MEB2781786.1 COX15/CtaA family protein [Algoriphagus sp. C2-6-M1]
MKQNTNNAINSFRRVSMITVIAVYLLILIGGIVRSSGSGMGCPDWPKCFGNVIPPTSVDQLPVNYQEIYLNKRLAKNERFVATLEKLGFSDKATEIANDKSIYVEEEFNPVKTWIEYLNRLAGVVIGLLIVLTVWKSLPLRKMDGWITILSIFNLILVIFIGWIGSIVVSTNLLHWMITFHMMLALLLVSLLIYVYHRSGKLIQSKRVKMNVPRRIELLLLIGIILMLVQVVLGTQVREQIDIISSSLGNMLRDEWVGRVGLDFLIHRSFSLVVLGIHVLYFFWAFKYTLRRSQVNLWSQALMILIILEIATGMGMSYFGIPAFLQPIHLLLGSLIIGAQVILLLEIRENIQFRLNTN